MDYTFHSKFIFCPVCGNRTFEANCEKSKKCRHCGFVYYVNASAAVAAFVTNEKGELLVCKRAKDPAKGMLDLPGGFIDAGETAEEAIAREIKEELNVIVQSARYLFSLPNVYRYSGLDIPTLDMFFEIKIADLSTLKADDDVEEVFFYAKENIDIEEFGFSSIKNAIRKWQTREEKL